MRKFTRQELLEKDAAAEEIIETYAKLHAGTAFVAGHLGGQFGADRIPLTALTTKMILDICNLYDISDPGVQAVHIGHAIVRLTVNGTIIADTVMNWIPIVGPGANSLAAYALTKQVGRECVKDIENGFLDSIQEALKNSGTRKEDAAPNAINTTGGELIGASVTDAMANAAPELTKIVPLSKSDLDEAMRELSDSTKNRNKNRDKIENLIDALPLKTREKSFLERFIKKVSADVALGKPIDARAALSDAIIKLVSDGLIKSAKLGLDHDKMVLDSIEKISNTIPTFFEDIDAFTSRYEKATDDDHRRADLAKFISGLNGVVKVLDLGTK
jgi:uncharacterized protein (DUF697 family)